MLCYLKKIATPFILIAVAAVMPVSLGAADYGDANNDGMLSAQDSAYILECVLNPTQELSAEMLKCCDVTGDGIISAQDAAAVLAKVLDSGYMFAVEDTTTSGNDTTVTTESTTQSTTESTTESTTQAVPENGIKLGNEIFVLGEQEGALPVPVSKGITPDGITWYSYSNDYVHYTKVGVADGKVVKIVTFDTDAVYGSAAIGDLLTEPGKKGYLYVEEYKANNNVIADLYYDKNNNNMVYSITLTAPSYLSSGTSYTADTISEMQKQITDMTNACRVQCGVGVLYFNDKLTGVAQAHAEDMAENMYFSHTSQDGRTFDKRITNAGLNYSYCGENIDAGYYSAEAAINGWLNSAGHRENLMSVNFTHIGVGAAYNPNDEYGTRFVQDFMRPAI